METKAIKVAAGVVVDEAGRILVAKRPNHKHQGGLWEFPGGKIEQGESTHDALARELDEEVGIRIDESEPLIRIWHQYPDKHICLDVLRVTRFDGHPWGREGQEIAWVPADELPSLEFPAANVPIVAAARLPRTLMITGPFETERECLERLQCGLEKKPGLVQFRAPRLDPHDYIALARQAHALCQKRSVPMLANCTLDIFQQINCEGLHLNSLRLHELNSRPISSHLWLSVACHDSNDIAQAQKIGADFACLSPVQRTKSHPEQAPMGWQQFGSQAEKATLPVYALGGVTQSDVSVAVNNGAQGIAAIGAFWDGAR